MSVIWGVVGSIFGMITLNDVYRVIGSVALAFVGGMVGYAGNALCKYIFKKLKSRHLTLLLPIVILLASCTPQQRLDRIIKNHPELMTYDSVHVSDTFFVPGIKVDTLVKLLPGDTLIIEREKLSIQLVRIGDTTHLVSEVSPDTVYMEKLIMVPKYQTAGTESDHAPPQYQLMILSALIGLCLGLMFSIRFGAGQ